MLDSPLIKTGDMYFRKGWRFFSDLPGSNDLNWHREIVVRRAGKAIDPERESRKGNHCRKNVNESTSATIIRKADMPVAVAAQCTLTKTGEVVAIRFPLRGKTTSQASQ
jgi:hypothetical protein